MPSPATARGRTRWAAARALFGGLALLAACAADRPPPTRARASPLPPPPLPRSSIVAVLGHRGELALDGAQVAKLEDIERALEQRQAPLLEAPERRGSTGERGDDPRGERGGRRGRGRTRERERPAGPSTADLFDDADTAAFVEAQAVLRDAQRDRAREIAERYREALADARERAARGAP